ncbi:hypothetical protein GCM10025867_40360 [Frondihabitans sucicola]|uniref:Transposase n=1 Tax=Frondihabitans sucicola TaxID=1268041 RepID=A0ABM8GTL6_9MICO|nr:hypothetical protein GCM10025867_40360 [Frondihabitans sucicola]
MRSGFAQGRAEGETLEAHRDDEDHEGKPGVLELVRVLDLSDALVEEKTPPMENRMIETTNA